MEQNQVVPDVIKKAPPEQLKVKYGSGASVQMGNELTPTQVKDEPTVKWNADNKQLYVLCLVDPDAPSRSNPKFREWRHWLVVNIPGSNVSKGEVLVEYVGAAPPQNTGLHRYVFLVYLQTKRLKFEESLIPKTSGGGRAKTSISKFAEKYKLGDPVAGDFFQAKWDDYCQAVYKQLKGGK